MCNEVISKYTITESWKKAVTILIYKKGDHSLTENFRPITFEPLTLKTFISIIRDQIYENLKELLEKIDSLDIHPKNKMLIYQRYILCKIIWDLTVTNISITWIKKNLDIMVSNYVPSCLEIPISGTLKIVTLSKHKYVLNFINASTHFTVSIYISQNCEKYQQRKHQENTQK